MSKPYPWEEYKEVIKCVYIGKNYTLQELKAYLQTLEPTFNPCKRVIKIHLKKWGFTKNKKRERPAAPIAEERTITTNVTQTIQPSNAVHSKGDHQQYVKNARAAFLRNLEASVVGMQNGLSMEVGSTNLVQEPQYTATLLGSHPVHIFPEISRIARTFPTAMRQLPAQLQQKVCYEFLRNFLEFDGGVDMVLDSSSPATDVQYLRLDLQLAMQTPVIEHRLVVRFTDTLCNMVNSLAKQLHGDNESNKALVKELKLPTNNLPYEEQITPIGLALQLQFFAWLYHTVKWDYSGWNINVEHLLITMTEYLISIAIVIAKRNRSEKRIQTRKHLSAFAFKMNKALPAILGAKHCCWSMLHLSDNDSFNICGGRCTRYREILNRFEYFYHDGLENLDFSECDCEDITSKHEVECPSQLWLDLSLFLETSGED